MSAAEAIALGFLLGILGSGFSAVLALRLQNRAREAQLRQAVVAELLENWSALNEQKSLVLHRSAWDAARTVPFPSRTFQSIAKAYRETGRLMVKMELARARAAGVTTGIAEVLATGSPPALGPAIAAIEAALRALGANTPTIAENV